MLTAFVNVAALRGNIVGDGGNDAFSVKAGNVDDKGILEAGHTGFSIFKREVRMMPRPFIAMCSPRKIKATFKDMKETDVQYKKNRYCDRAGLFMSILLTCLAVTLVCYVTLFDFFSSETCLKRA